MGRKYSEAGVDFGDEGRFVESLQKEAGQKELPGIFAKFSYKNGRAVGMSLDGVGSKILAYQEEPKTIHLAGYDLGAMLLHDLAAEFIRPLLLGDYVANNKNDPRIAKQIGMGLKHIADETRMLYLAGGECATLKDQIKEGTFDWAGAVVGVEDEKQHKEWIAIRDDIGSGITLVGIEGYDEKTGEHTLQSNGLTLARKLPEQYRHLLRVPSVLLTDLMMDLRDSGIADFFVPITGGGYTNLDRVLKGKPLNAEVSLDDFPTIFKIIKDKLGVEIKEMFEVYNMGNAVIVGTTNPGEAIDMIGKSGKKGKEIGELTKGEGEVFVDGIKLDKYST